GRVSASPDYYLDADGGKMPLSNVYSARVPIITGTSKNNFNEVGPLLLKIEKDELMRSSVVGLNRKMNGDIELELRKADFKVLFGKPIHIERKVQKCKAFYTKTKQDRTLDENNMANLT